MKSRPLHPTHIKSLKFLNLWKLSPNLSTSIKPGFKIFSDIWKHFAKTANKCKTFETFAGVKQTSLWKDSEGINMISILLIAAIPPTALWALFIHLTISVISISYLYTDLVSIFGISTFLSALTTINKLRDGEVIDFLLREGCQLWKSDTKYDRNSGKICYL